MRGILHTLSMEEFSISICIAGWKSLIFALGLDAGGQACALSVIC